MCRLVTLLLRLCRRGLDIELCTRCCVFLIHCHKAQIVNTHSLLGMCKNLKCTGNITFQLLSFYLSSDEMSEIQQIVRTSMGEYRELIGKNLAGDRCASCSLLTIHLHSILSLHLGIRYIQRLEKGGSELALETEPGEFYASIDKTTNEGNGIVGEKRKKAKVRTIMKKRKSGAVKK